jgi:hypothetical protein
MASAEGFVKFTVKRALEKCAEDLQFFNDVRKGAGAMRLVLGERGIGHGWAKRHDHVYVKRPGLVGL